MSSMTTAPWVQESYPSYEIQPEIIGPTDDRVLVSDTTAIPFRFVCCIDRYFVRRARVEPNRTTGVLISPSHVLTVGHTVDSRRFGRVSRMTIAPGRNGRATPFGTVAAKRWVAHPRWVSSRDIQFDFALITLASPIGSSTFGGRPLGCWGNAKFGGGTSLRVVDPARMRGADANVSGYPGDKCLAAPATAACPAADRGSTQWRSFARIAEPSTAARPRLMSYEMDTKGGHSGSPVWLRWQTVRFLIAIHRGFNRTTRLNEGVRVTKELLDTVRGWM